MRCFVGSVFCILAASLVFAQPAGGSSSASIASPPLGESENQTLSLSPVREFRQLLAMPQPELDRALAQRTPNKRKSLQTKIEEYRKMTPEERENKLRLVELWYYLRQLLELAPAQRADRLAAVPESERPFIEERLKQWDLLPSDFQKKVLENDLGIHYVLHLDTRAPAPREPLPSKSAEDWLALEEKLREWRTRPQEQRQRMYEQFQEFFDLPPKEKEKTLHVLSDQERQELEKSLQVFEQLPPHQRAVCIESFRKFANLSKEERDQFLQNAGRWQELTPRDRQSWINLMNLFPAQSGPPIPGASPPRPPPGVGSNSVTGASAKPLPKLPGAK